MIICWIANQKIYFLTTDLSYMEDLFSYHNLWPFAVWATCRKNFLLMTQARVACHQRLAGQNSCHFSEIIHTFFEYIWWIHDSVPMILFAPAVGWPNSKQIGPENLDTDLSIVLHFVNAMIFTTVCVCTLLCLTVWQYHDGEIYLFALWYMYMFKWIHVHIHW